jgi:para-aminobenzoate synthetase component 1
VPVHASDDPVLTLGVHPAAVLVDHLTREAWVVACDSPWGTAEESARRLMEVIEPVPPSGWELSQWTVPGVEWHSQSVARIRRYIEDGDIYQANLTGFLTGAFQGDPAGLWQGLLEDAGAPFSAYFDCGERVIMSWSPERFLRADPRGRVETRPIKGTRRRATHPNEDAALAVELMASEKDRAELLMIVDMHRNDLGRVCRPGSVQVPTLLGLRTFPAVHHLESVIQGQLASGCSSLDLVRAAFPAGSITGAPKIRAMEIIHELEPQARGPYCGAMGYLDARGGLDLSVAIRTAVVERGVLRYGAGGGIVWDSMAETEYDELLVKGRPLTQAARSAVA